MEQRDQRYHALEARFGTAHQTELNCVRLKTRTHHREESLAELAEDMERLVRLAYPNTTESMVEVLSKDHFIDCLPDEEVQLCICQNKPTRKPWRWLWSWNLIN